MNIVNDDGSNSQVTGFSIGSDVTVTISVSDTYGAIIPLYVNGPCLNSGAIFADNQGTTAQLYISCSSYFGDVGSSIVNNGPDGQGVSSGGITIYAGVIWNQGTLQANGSDGPSGGAGGSIYLDAYELTTLFNTGGLYSVGGVGTVGAGGNGGGVNMTGAGNVDNSGPIDVSGGDGAASGGSGGSINILAGASAVHDSVIRASRSVKADFQSAPGLVSGGSLLNSGAITAIGGSVDGSCVPQPSVQVCSGLPTSAQQCYYTTAIACAAGAGGQPINLQATGGALVNNAAISGGGGSSVNGAGGAGGVINLGVIGGTAPVAPGDLVVSGSLDASGGAGASGGGNGGAISVSLDPGALPNGQEIILYGYDHVDSSGGAGAPGGGPGGAIQLTNTVYSVTSEVCGGDSCYESASVNEPGGSVVNDVNLYARGGAGGAGVGGGGGAVTLTTQSQYAFSGDDFEQVINAGLIDDSGGDGGTGATGGGITFYGLTGLTNTGALTARGGAGNTDTGGSGASIQLTSGAGAASNSGDLDASGGAGSTTGGAAGTVSLAALSCDDSGQLSAAGGAAGAGGSGGAGGQVSLWSESAASVITAGAPGGISVAGGTAPDGLPGPAGQVLVDGWDNTNQWSH